MVCRILSAVIMALFLATASAANAQERPTGNFDFYVLSLSWSPTFCAGNRGKDSPDQCATDKPFRFIVHGLWPQNERGYPEFCANTQPRRVPEDLGRAYFDIMPSMGLIGHQWRKHGSCSGLSQEAYLQTTREALNKIKLPADIATASGPLTFSAAAIEDKFLDANPGLRPESIAISCEGNRLEEVRICLAKDLSFRTCAEVDRKGCTINRVNVPPPAR
ncbi:ribonuclease [Rhizobium sp. FY34]|uniref:ribonuclease T2 family protein n=1 Tax=Rhizobium sp. FY34 TaxID=2562309 RepID=UPI0010BF9DA6|nr:ribonuclease [Rhizobium sp. FY34]